MKHIVFFLTAALLLNASCGSSDEGGKTDPPAAPVPVAPTTELGKADEAIENLQLKPGKLISINQVNAANCRRAVAAGMCIDIMASDKIVFASDMTDERLDGLFAECGEAIRSTKADFWGLHLPYQTYDISSTNENMRVTAVLKLKRLIELTIEHLRPQHFVIHPGTGTILTTGGDFAERTVQSRKSLAELQRHIESCNAQHGTKAILCVENCARSLAYDGDSLLDLLDAEGLEKVRVCLDTGHALIPLNGKYIDPVRNGDALDVLRRIGTRLGTLHIQQNPGALDPTDPKDKHLEPFSGGLIDMFLFGILQGNAKTNWIWIVIVGIGYFIVYYLLFGFLIKRFDLKTPGRDDSEEVKLYRRSDVEARKNGDNGSEASSEDALSQTICQGLGGKKNISDVDCCATRLRCTVHKAECVDDALLKSTGASGVVHKGNGVQIIYGPRVSVIKSNLEDYLETAPDEEFTAGGNDVDATAHVGVDTNVDGGANAGVAENANTSSAEATVVETIVISSPITGLAADLSTTPDEAFAGKMMGDGAVVTPEDSVVRAPEDGEVCFVFETKHAIGFLTDSGVSLLIHMGIDTVALNGEGFEVFVENGQKVKKGEPLLSLNLDYLKENAPSLASPVLCTELEDNQKVRLLKDGQIKAGEALFAIDIYE